VSFNPSDKTSAVVLTNGNLTADVSQGSNQGVRSIGSVATGKFYFEVVLNTIVSAQGQCLGIATATASLPGLTIGGTPGAGAAIMHINVAYSLLRVFINAGAGYFDFSETASNGDVICVAVDLVNQRIWFRRNAGNWNANATNNPATNVGGADISFLSGAAAFAVAGGNWSSGGMVMTLAASNFVYPIPSGFGAFGGTISATTYAALPTTPLMGQRSFVTDATVSTFGSTASAGGGTNKVPVFWNGANWLVG